ncbi:MAG: N-acetyl-gamma-glutamyl-phosphate reductase [Chloroflexus sp.]|jgi:N-acetyl-gamma-glutamyl-phosphate reductase|uniref:N-acetyl-gamma-glutamyl-phosphate reductase n=1 Tax=Chloroflexus sp. TaxID=1904827 RepID=UPI0021DC468F|nr:N-acetyl-gamma-glutamyl-phosphate reductase [Chloroflexus sp.]GIV89361.1 MAG: N-acetyl-gamma-glutamyl-phosphate reductase [Chloroflexus sp.]
MARVGIYGATGYTGIELLKLLFRHPEVEIAFATARSAAGQRLSEVFPIVSDLRLVAVEEVDPTGVDLVFTCLPHNTPELIPIVQRSLAAGAKVIDFSDTFRITDPNTYTARRGKPHPAPELLAIAVYGLPELHRERIRQGRLVANTGCYPLTAILPLVPLVRANLLADPTVIVDSKSGVSGAGRSLSLKTHFGETHETFSAYNVGRVHRHLAEMEQETGLHIIFAPHLLPVFRGILSTIYVNLKPDVDDMTLAAVYADAYSTEPFVHVLPPGRLPELRHVQHTNHVVIGHQMVEPGRAIVVAVVDNLVKGASGQAVQNMNLMLGFPETTGLPL